MSHFIMALQQIDGGGAVAVADEQLKEVLAKVRATGKKGQVTMQVVIAPNGERGFEITAKVSAKAPDVDFGKSFFFSDRDGHLTRTPPKEESAGLLSVGGRKDG